MSGQVVPLRKQPVIRETDGSRHCYKAWMPVMGYAMQIDAPHGPIKFGASIDVLKRRAQVQAHSPYDVEIILIVDRGRSFEAKMKRECEIAHIRGEWYEARPQILSWIANKVDSGASYRQHTASADYCRRFIAPKVIAKHGPDNLPWQLRWCVEGIALDKPLRGTAVADYLREHEDDILTVEEIAGYQRIAGV
ncbi:MAG: hypothetical protein KF895_03160 [Parvibaculum sp.]|nr:hypothetical protein [Parvibaculum sp.]